MGANHRPRAAAIIVDDGRVALIKREHSERGTRYFLFPGGGLENGETYEEAVVREALEETGLETTVDRLVAVVHRMGHPQYHFLVHVIGGRFGTGRGPEMVGQHDPSRGTYEAVWMPVSGVLEQPVYPQCVCRLLVEAIKGSWPHAVERCVDDD